MNNPLIIETSLVRKLIDSQFPQWKHFDIKPIIHDGWDNRTFHLGNKMLVRMPSAAEYAQAIEKEQRWLPILEPLLPIKIPSPLVMGQPAYNYPWKWSVYRWLEGETATSLRIANPIDFAKNLAQFLAALQEIDPTNGPLPGPHNFYRGGSLEVYDSQIRHAFTILKDKIDIDTAAKIWESALATKWNKEPVWVHGDISLGNLLVQNGHLSAVIDFGALAIGDPACDLAIAWTFFKGEARETFQSALNLDEGTWVRARAWTLWKALIIAAGLCKTNTIEGKDCWRIIEEVKKSKF